MSTSSAPPTGPSAGPTRRQTQLPVLAGVIAVALNLRVTITVIGPLVPTIREDLGISNAAIGLVGTIPVLAFGLFATVAPALGRRLGIGRTLAGAMLLLTVATLVRSSGSYALLLAGTAFIGIAIAVCNVLLPALAKATFDDRASTVITGYTALMVLAATGSASLAVPLAQARGWAFSTGIWAIVSGVAAIVIVGSLIVEGRLVPDDAVARRAPRGGMGIRAMLRSPVAWTITAFMGLQSTAYYIVLAWLPDILVANGLDDLQAGVMVGVLNIAGFVGILGVPRLHAGRADQRRSTAVAVALVLAGSVLLLVPGLAVAAVASATMGLGLGATVALALSFFTFRTTGTDDASTVSGMAQSIGYTAAAAGPVLWGVLRDLSGNWTAPTVALIVTCALSGVAGMAAARDRTIEHVA